MAGRPSKRGLFARAGLDVEFYERRFQPGRTEPKPGRWHSPTPRRRDRLEGRFEKHGAGVAVGPRSAWLAHADVWIGGWLVEPGARQRLLAAAA